MTMNKSIRRVGCFKTVGMGIGECWLLRNGGHWGSGEGLMGFPVHQFLPYSCLNPFPICQTAISRFPYTPLFPVPYSLFPVP